MVLIEEKEFATSGKQKDIVQKETNAVSGTTVMRVARGWGAQQATDSPGSRTCVCAHTLIHFGVAHAGEGRTN